MLSSDVQWFSGLQPNDEAAEGRGPSVASRTMAFNQFFIFS